MALFGIPPLKKTSPPPAAPAQTGSAVFDVTTAEFETLVLRASMTTPVLVDFWAPWCGPCKQLMPVLEGEVAAAKGEVLLAKVNIDENPDLAQALRIQSVPTVMAFFQGQPVTAFAGARPAGEIRRLIEQLVKMARSAKPDALDIPAAMKEAATFAAEKDFTAAQDVYMRVLAQDEMNVEAYNGMVRVLIDAGAADEAQAFADSVPETVAKNPAFTASKTALALAAAASKSSFQLAPLLQEVKTAPDDHAARFDLAAAQFAGGARAEAIDNLLYIVRADRGWNDDAARKELLRYFEALGFSDPLSVEGRKKLSRLLFS